MSIIQYIILGLIAQVFFVSMFVGILMYWLNNDFSEMSERVHKGLIELQNMADKSSKMENILSIWILLIWPIGIFLQYGIPLMLLSSHTDEERTKWRRRYAMISYFRTA